MFHGAGDVLLEPSGARHGGRRLQALRIPRGLREGAVGQESQARQSDIVESTELAVRTVRITIIINIIIFITTITIIFNLV